VSVLPRVKLDAGSGIEMDILMGGVLEFRDGKIVRLEDFDPNEKALEAPGLDGQALPKANVEIVRDINQGFAHA